MKYPRYVRARKGKLHYQRDYPSSLMSTIGRKTFTHPLGLPEGTTGSALNTAVAKASEAYELRCKVAQNSDPELYNAQELDRLAVEILRANRLQPEQAMRATLDDSIEAADRMLWEGYAGVRTAEAEDRQPTVQEKAARLAYEKLVEKAQARPLTLTDVWNEYLAEKGVDTTTREGKRQQQWWDKIVLALGEHLIAAEGTLDAIHHGLDTYAAQRQAESIKGQSIEREISQPVAALRRASRKYRLGWVIEPPLLKHSETSAKDVLTQEQQQQLMEHIASTDKPHLGAISLLLLQGGMMASEIDNLDLEKDVHLNAEIPHVIVRKGKTRSRPRIIPIVLRADYIAEHLPEALEWLHKQTDSGWSHHLKKYLRKATGHPTITAHQAGRHTFKANAAHCGANPMLAAAIAGWSSKGSGVSDVMMNYGSAGLSKSEGLKALWNESKKIHAHLSRTTM